MLSRAGVGLLPLGGAGMARAKGAKVARMSNVECIVSVLGENFLSGWKLGEDFGLNNRERPADGYGWIRYCRSVFRVN